MAEDGQEPVNPPQPPAAGGNPPPLDIPGLPLRGLPPLEPSSQPGARGAVAPLPETPLEPPRPQGPTPEQIEYERKVGELERRLAEEHERLLLANLKSQQEAATSARVEVSIRELQDKLRRDRREAESEESRRAMETKTQELEARLAQERETWVTTLKNQMQAREGQEKEIEGHFSMRLQDMERRWLEEKAGWQRTVLSKDEEIRHLRALAEKLKGADAELSRSVAENKQLEARLADLARERAEAAGKVQSAGEREKEAVQLRADLAVARQQHAMLQERLERDLQAVRASAREREERLLADQERLHKDLATVGERLRAEHEAELRRFRAEADAESAKHREGAERATVEVHRLRAVCGAMERQLAAGRTQIEELKRAAAEWERTQERYKAEFVVLQRKWVEREKEIRAEAAAQGQQMLEAEKVRIKAQAQEELGQRAARMAEQMEKEKAVELRQREAGLRIDIEREALTKAQEAERVWEKARRELSAELDRLRAEMVRKDTEWSEKLLGKETELVGARGQNDDLSARFKRAEELRREGEARALELEKAFNAAREELGGLRRDLGDLQGRLEKEEKLRQSLQAEKAELERLCTAQAAQVKALEENIERGRGEVSRENHLAAMALAEKDKLAAALAAAEGASAQAEQALSALEASRQEAEQAKERLEADLARQREEMAQTTEALRLRLEAEAARAEALRQEAEALRRDLETRRQAWEAEAKRSEALAQQLEEEQKKTLLSRLLKKKDE